MHQISFTITGKNTAEMIAGIKAHLALFEGNAMISANVVASSAGSPATAKAAKTQADSTPAKAAKAVKNPPPPESDDEDDFDLDGTGEDDTDELSLDDDAPDAEEEAEEPSTTLEEVIGAFQKFAKRHGREKAVKVLAKFKAKSVRDLKPAQFDEALSALKK